MKKFDFRRKLKGMDVATLKRLESKHMDNMLRYQGIDDKESDKHGRYLGYIQDAINKVINKTI